MSTFIIVDTNIIDAEKLNQYGQQAAITVAKFDGKFIAKGPIDALHGTPDYQGKAIIEFADQKSAENWYHSDEYQALVPLRNEAIECQFHLLNGL
jgi:uncharacterized protein (DUF1330 family)